LRIVFDNIIFYLQKTGGITTYWFELIKRAVADPSVKAFFSEPHARLDNHLRSALAVPVRYFETRPLVWLSLSAFSIPIEEKTIFQSSYYRISRSPKAINVVTVYDFVPERYFTGLRKLVHLKRKKTAIACADGLVCISHQTKEDLLKNFPFLDEKKIRVIYCGVGEEYGILPSSTLEGLAAANDILPGKLVLYVGSRALYKNFYVAAEAVSLLNDDFKLLIIGEKLSRKEKVFLEAQLPNRYRCLSAVDNHTLNFYYNISYCLIYPSSYEGFGIPLLEAMKAGCPVVTTNTSSIPEVVGDAAVMVEEISPERFAGAVLKLSDDSFRKRLIEKGFERSGQFSWDKCYNDLKRFYRDLYHATP